MPDTSRTIVQRFFEELCNQRQMAAADQIIAADHVYHDPSSPWVGVGPQGMRDLLGAYHTAFPDSTWTVEETIEAGDTIVTRWTGRGTHQGDLAGIAPTGRTVSVPGIWIHRLAGGKIVESWNAWDTLGMMRQLGVAPKMGQAAGA